MAIIIEAVYSKKLGLPQFSSHSYSVTIQTELQDLSQVERESSKLYTLLQGSVDREIQETGFMPGEDQTRTGLTNVPRANAQNGNGDHWACSPKQKDLILKVVAEHGLDKQEIETLAQERFGNPVKVLNRLEASGLIDELLSRYGGKENGNRHKAGRSRSYQRGGAR